MRSPLAHVVRHLDAVAKSQISLMLEVLVVLLEHLVFIRQFTYLLEVTLACGHDWQRVLGDLVGDPGFHVEVEHALFDVCPRRLQVLDGHAEGRIGLGVGWLVAAARPILPSA